MRHARANSTSVNESDFRNLSLLEKPSETQQKNRNSIWYPVYPKFKVVYEKRRIPIKSPLEVNERLQKEQVGCYAPAL